MKMFVTDAWIQKEVADEVSRRVGEKEKNFAKREKALTKRDKELTKASKELKAKLLAELEQKENNLENKKKTFEIEKKNTLFKIKAQAHEEHFEEMKELRAKVAQVEAMLEAKEEIIKFLKADKDKGTPVNVADLKGLMFAANGDAKSMKKLMMESKSEDVGLQ